MKLFSILLFIFIGVVFSQSTSLLEFIQDNPCGRGFGVGYGCEEASLTYSLGSNWTSNGINYYLYNIIFTNPSSSVFPAFIYTEIETSDHPPVFSQYWNIELSVENGPDGPENFASTDLASPIYPGSTLSAGFVIQGDQILSVVEESIECDYSSYYSYCASLNQASTSSSTASQSSTTGSPVLPATTSSSSTASQSSTTGSQPSTTTSSSNSECLLYASTSFLNSWNDNVNYYQQYSVNIQNSGVSVATSVDFVVAFGDGSINQYWNMQTVTYDEEGEHFSATLYNLQPGQSYSGLGFIWSINQTLYTELENTGGEGRSFIAPWNIEVEVSYC